MAVKTALAKAPPEVPKHSHLAICAPLFHRAVLRVLDDMRARGLPCLVVETLRTPERQAYLYGFGRTYDDGRGRVTKAASSLTSWHGYGLAADIVHAARYWNAGPDFWTALGETAEAHGLTWGGRWRSPDRPHVQWGGCPVSPTKRHHGMILAPDGMRQVWADVGALGEAV
jgi:hypothetical protein